MNGEICKAPEWRPLETCPRDGTIIIIGSETNVYVAFWKQEWSWRKFRVEKSFHALWGLHERPEGESDNATHWMPFPEPVGPPAVEMAA